MPKIASLFVTRIYREELASATGRKLLAELEHSARMVAAGDAAGQAWCTAHDYPGYTSYASLSDLPERDPAFADLTRILDAHVTAFARELDLDLGGKPLSLDSIWINVLDPGGFHTAHIHPHSVISGTLYLSVPKGAGAIKFEDPRLALMMAAPPRKSRAALDNRTFVQIAPKPGTLLLWESFLRHEVPVSHADSERISVSFNYRWG
ncbi:MAG: TIGR02466 family protein [Hyphomicrobium sp.]